MVNLVHLLNLLNLGHHRSVNHLKMVNLVNLVHLPATHLWILVNLLNHPSAEYGEDAESAGLIIDLWNLHNLVKLMNLLNNPHLWILLIRFITRRWWILWRWLITEIWILFIWGIWLICLPATPICESWFIWWNHRAICESWLYMWMFILFRWFIPKLWFFFLRIIHELGNLVHQPSGNMHHQRAGEGIGLINFLPFPSVWVGEWFQVFGIL